MFLHYIGCRIINPQLYPVLITPTPVGTIQAFIILPVWQNNDAISKN